jgi:predicted phosphoribosyltransferase
LARGGADASIEDNDAPCARSASIEDRLDELRGEVEEIVFLGSPSPFIAVGALYAEFAQLADADVVALLEKRHRATSGPADRPNA